MFTRVDVFDGQMKGVGVRLVIKRNVNQRGPEMLVEKASDVELGGQGLKLIVLTIV